MSKTPTAEEFWKEISPDEEFGILGDLKKNKLHRHVFEAMRRYAKLHVESALKAASINAEIQEEAGNIFDPEDRYYVVNQNSILNSYPLTNIK